MPATATFTWSGQKLEPAVPGGNYPALELAITMKLAASGTVEYTKGTLLGRVSATGRYAVYDSTALDGSEVAVCILAYDISVDTAGLIAFTTTAGSAGELGLKSSNVGAYFSGVFRGEDLKQSGTGSIDSAALADLGGRFLNGDLTNGLFMF